MTPRFAALGIVASALVVAAFDVPAGGEDQGQEATVPATPPVHRRGMKCALYPKATCRIGLTKIEHGHEAPVRNVEECARLAGLPPPPERCHDAGSCGWVMNVSCSDPDRRLPCWVTVCEVPFWRTR